jgi:hypothetical protein
MVEPYKFYIKILLKMQLIKATFGHPAQRNRSLYHFPAGRITKDSETERDEDF